MALAARSEIKVVDPNTVKVRGYSVITGVEFDYFDPHEWRRRRMTVDPGAFDSVLARRSKPIPMYWSHGVYGLQLGELVDTAEDDTGLFFEGIPFATTEAVDILTVMDGRSRTGASILFDFGEVSEDGDGLEHILSFSEIHEMGPTPEGVNPHAFAELVDRAPGDATIQTPEPATASAAESSDAALALAIYRATARMRRF